MDHHSEFHRAAAAPAGLWQRKGGVPLKDPSGRPSKRARALLTAPKPPKKRALGVMWRRGRKSGDVPVLHPVDKWDRMIWVRPDTVAASTEGKKGRRRRVTLAGRNLVVEPVKAAWISSRHGAEEAHRFGHAWTLFRVELEAAPNSWHRTPASPDGRAGQLTRRPPVRRKVVTPTLD
jgi:hypothetical protein